MPFKYKFLWKEGARNWYFLTKADNFIWKHAFEHPPSLRPPASHTLSNWCISLLIKKYAQENCYLEKDAFFLSKTTITLCPDLRLSIYARIRKTLLCSKVDTCHKFIHDVSYISGTSNRSWFPSSTMSQVLFWVLSPFLTLLLRLHLQAMHCCCY